MNYRVVINELGDTKEGFSSYLDACNWMVDNSLGALEYFSLGRWCQYPQCLVDNEVQNAKRFGKMVIR